MNAFFVIRGIYRKWQFFFKTRINVIVGRVENRQTTLYVMARFRRIDRKKSFFCIKITGKEKKTFLHTIL